MIEPASGVLLISDPFLKDPNFMRTVVLLCEHHAKGSFGFVLNRPYEQRLHEFIPDLDGHEVPVYYGGPVQPDTLHFVHAMPAEVPDGNQISKGVYWGGNFETVINLIQSNSLDLSRIRFFLGYSGWGKGQLEEEMLEKSWLTVPATRKLVFAADAAQLWRNAVQELDESFHPIVNYPIDPQLN
jgi:putative transcriptional regulator